MTNHLVHFHCSPSRRSFVSGRLPIHHGEGLSSMASDDIDLRWTLIGGKLQSQGYKTHWVGKGHTGYMSVAHLPINRGFDSHLGFLSGAQSYTSSDRWSNNGPFNNSTYSTFLYGDRAMEIVQTHPADKPLFMYLAWQAVHSPYDTVPGYDCKTTSFEPYSGVYAQMLHAADDYVGRLVKLLQKRDMYKDTLLVFTSDNGGVAWNGLMGNNFPLAERSTVIGQEATAFQRLCLAAFYPTSSVELAQMSELTLSIGILPSAPWPVEALLIARMTQQSLLCPLIRAVSSGHSLALTIPSAPTSSIS